MEATCQQIILQKPKRFFSYFNNVIGYEINAYAYDIGWENNKFYIYSTDSSEKQFNALGYNYMAIAIG